MLQIISLLLENKPGALLRVTGLLGSRGYNIESLTVARTRAAATAHMTIVVDVDPKVYPQVIKQMNRLINVLQATAVSEAPLASRELVLLRVRVLPEGRTAVLKQAEIFGARVIDSAPEGFVIEATGDAEKVEEFLEVMRSNGDIEVSRSGAVSIPPSNKKLRLQPPVSMTIPNRDREGVVSWGGYKCQDAFTKNTEI